MSEKALQGAVEQCARLLGYRVYHTYDSRRSEPGYPDLCMVRSGRLIYAELKAARGRVRPEQHAWLADLAAAGAETFLWRPEHWLSGEIERILR